MVGFICVTGKKIIGTDIFAASNIFYDEVPALLPGYIEAAIIDGGKPSVEETDIRMFADKILHDELQQADYCRKNGKIFKFKGRVIHVTAY